MRLTNVTPVTHPHNDRSASRGVGGSPSSNHTHATAANTMMTSMHETPFVQNFRPRVERTVPLTLYTRAQADPRPGSIAWTTADNALGSVSITSTLSKSASELTLDGIRAGPITSRLFEPTVRNPFLHASAQIPQPVKSQGEKRSVFKVHRVGDDHFTFTQGASLLDPGVGAVCDRDTVLQASTKLRALFPEKMPSLVKMGDAALPGTMPGRRVRAVYTSKGRLLTETSPIGTQCRTQTWRRFVQRWPQSSNEATLH